MTRAIIIRPSPLPRLSRLSLAVASLVLLGARPAAAQLPIPAFSIAGGVSHYHLAGSGTAPFGALRVDIPLLALVGEASLGAFRPKEDGGVQRTYIIPEAQLQFQLLPILVRPYLGIGAGWFRAISGPDPHRNDLTVSASAGVRIGIPLTGIGVRGELRVRGIGSGFNSSAAEWTLGASW